MSVDIAIALVGLPQMPEHTIGILRKLADVPSSQSIFHRPTSVSNTPLYSIALLHQRDNIKSLKI